MMESDFAHLIVPTPLKAFALVPLPPPPLPDGHVFADRLDISPENRTKYT